MGRVYDFGGAQDASSSYITVIGLASATTIRPEILRIECGVAGTPADNVLSWLLQRFTAAGTSTAVTPIARDPADPASLATAGQNHTAEPTYTANATPFALSPLHQKNKYVQEFAPGYGIKLPATAANGIGLQVKHSSFAAECNASFGYEE